MNPLLEKLKTDAQAKTATRDALLAKGAEMSADDVKSVNDINTELRGIVDQINGIKTADEETKKLNGFFNDPALTINLGTQNQTGKQAEATVLGLQQAAGHADIEIGKGGIDIVQHGQGIFTEKQWKTLNDPAYLKAFNLYVRNKGMDGLDSIERKTLQEGIDDQGGFFVPAEMLNRLIEKTPAPTRVAGRVSTFQTGKNALTMPKVVYATDDIYTTGVRATLTGEIPSSSTVHRVTEPVFGQTRIEIGTWMLSMPLTNDLIEDADFPLLSWAAGKFQETINLLKDNQILNGTGVGTNPWGIFRSPGSTDEPAVVLSSTANNIDANQLRGLPFDLPEQYINANTCWVANRASFGKTVATMRAGGSTTTDGPFLFLDGQTFPGLVGRTPDTLVGYPLVYSAFCANIGDGAYPGVFGDLAGYYLVNRIGFSVQMIREKYAEENYQVMLGRLRFGGKVAEPYRMKIVKSDNA